VWRNLKGLATWVAVNDSALPDVSTPVDNLGQGSNFRESAAADELSTGGHLWFPETIRVGFRFFK
jgi:hypothetical protein